MKKNLLTVALSLATSTVFMGAFLVGIEQGKKINNPNAGNTEDELLEKDDIIREIIVVENGISEFASGNQASQLMNLPTKDLNELKDKNITIVIHNGNKSTIDEANNKINVSIESNQGDMIDLVSAVLDK